MKMKDVWPNPYTIDTPTSLLGAACRLLLFNLQESIVESWQDAHLATYGTCDHPLGKVRPRENFLGGIECRQCGMYVGKATTLRYLMRCQPHPDDCPPTMGLEPFCSVGFYREIPVVFWRERELYL